MCAVGFFGVDGSGLDSIDFIGYTNPNKLLFESLILTFSLWRRRNERTYWDWYYIKYCAVIYLCLVNW